MGVRGAPTSANTGHFQSQVETTFSKAKKPDPTPCPQQALVKALFLSLWGLGFPTGI